MACLLCMLSMNTNSEILACTVLLPKQSSNREPTPFCEVRSHPRRRAHRATKNLDFISLRADTVRSAGAAEILLSLGGAQQINGEREGGSGAAPERAWRARPPPRRTEARALARRVRPPPRRWRRGATERRGGRPSAGERRRAALGTPQRVEAAASSASGGPAAAPPGRAGAPAFARGFLGAGGHRFFASEQRKKPQQRATHH